MNTVHRTRCVALALLTLTAVSGCGGGKDVVREKISQIRVWEDQGWTASGRMTAYLSDRDEAVRERAVLALARVDDTLSLDSLKRALIGDPSPKVRAMAAFSLGIWTWKLGKAALLEALPKEEDPSAIVAILYALARVYAREEFATFLPYLRHPDPGVRAQAAYTLDIINRRDVTDSILPLFDDADPNVRKAAMFALLRVQSEPAARAGMRFIHDPDPAIRALAYRLVGSVRFAERRDTSMAGLNDPDPMVRGAIAESMAYMRDTAALHAVYPRWEKEADVPALSQFIRSITFHAQAEVGDRLPAMLRHPDPTIRAVTVTALCHRRDTPCWDMLTPAVSDPDARVRFAYLETLDKAAQFGGLDTQIVFPHLRTLSADPIPRVRARAVQSYVMFGGMDGGDYVNRIYHDTSHAAVATAIGLIGSLHILPYVDSLYQLWPKYQDDPNPDVKWAITAASANMLPSIQIDSLRQDIINWGMSDPNRLVRWYTIAVALKFRQDRRDGLGVYLTDLTVRNIDSLLPNYAAPPLARLETTRGTITMRLESGWAPRTVRQFIANARAGVYDNTVINDVQGYQMLALGDRTGDMSALPPANVRDEFNPLRAEPGSVAWSIVTRDSGRGSFMSSLSRLPYQDWRFPVFAQITEGLDIARSLTMADTLRAVTIVIPGA